MKINKTWVLKKRSLQSAEQDLPHKKIQRYKSLVISLTIINKTNKNTIIYEIF